MTEPEVGVGGRPICPSDEEGLRALHVALFPINYEALFYTRSTRGYDGIFGWVAVEQCAALTGPSPPASPRFGLSHVQ